MSIQNFMSRSGTLWLSIAKAGWWDSSSRCICLPISHIMLEQRPKRNTLVGLARPSHDYLLTGINYSWISTWNPSPSGGSSSALANMPRDPALERPNGVSRITVLSNFFKPKLRAINSVSSSWRLSTWSTSSSGYAGRHCIPYLRIFYRMLGCKVGWVGLLYAVLLPT